MLKLGLLDLLGHQPGRLGDHRTDGCKRIIVGSVNVVARAQQPSDDILDISRGKDLINVTMPLPGPVGCHRGGLTPLFIVTSDPSAGSVAVAVVLTSLLYAAAASRSVPWDRTLAAFIPVTGLALGHTDLDRVISVPLAAAGLWYLSGDSVRQVLPTVAATVASALAIAAGSKCNGVVPVGSDAVALVAAVVALLRCDDRTLTVNQMWAAVEFALVVLVLASDPAELGARETHLTWWNIVGQAVWLFARLRGAADYVWLTAVLINGVVLIGVWFMSGSKCTMLLDAQNEAGDLAYFFGNFILHYYPSLRLLSAPPKRILRPYRQLTVALAIIAIYCVSVDPRKVYGCDAWLTPDVVLISFWGVIGCVSVGLAWFGSWAIPALW